MECEFLQIGPADEVCRRWLEQDIESARLSLTYRAYYSLRPFIPIALRQLLQRKQGSPALPESWYLPEAFYSELLDACRQSSAAGQRVIHPWPSGAECAFVLTHDVETKAGLSNIIRIADIEEELGFRSAWNLVPYKYPIDRGLLSELRARGFEIGVHGYNHDGRLFASKAVFNRRLGAINAAAETFQAVGFRAPMVHRNLQWMQRLQVTYDSSCFDIDPFQAMPGGIGSFWPFLAGEFVELPYTMPQDHTVFVVLAQRDGRIWQRKAEWLARRHGMVLMLTHPDYLDSDQRLGVYSEFLEWAGGIPNCWNALPREVASWWQKRSDSRLRATDNGGCRIDGPAMADGQVSRMAVEGDVLRLAPETADSVHR